MVRKIGTGRDIKYNKKRSQDVRRLIILLARAIEPRNAESYIDTYGSKFRRRYEIYREGLRGEAL